MSVSFFMSSIAKLEFSHLGPTLFLLPVQGPRVLGVQDPAAIRSWLQHASSESKD